MWSVILYVKCTFSLVLYFKYVSNTKNYWPQLQRAPIKFGRFIKLYNINDKILYKQTDMGFAAEAGFFGGGKGGISPQKRV